jgi:hypothetical protein
MNYTELDPKPRVNAGFPVGLIGGLVMIFTSLVVFFMNGADTDGDLLVWFIQLVIYIILGRTAASRQAESQRHTFEPTKGIAGAGVGAPLTTSVMMWVFIIARGIIRDAMGMFIAFEPFSFCGWIIIDVLLALGIGNITGRSVLKQYNPNPYDTSNF